MPQPVNAEEAEVERFYEDLPDLPDLPDLWRPTYLHPKKMSFLLQGTGMQK